MHTILNSVNISPVEMDARKELGLRAGDTVRVHQKIQDKGKTRIQVFEGLVLARKHGNEPGATFTVRKVVDGIGVERIYPLYSPLIDKIEILKRSKVRRSKLYYIREKVTREIRRQMRRMKLMGIATESEAEVAARKEAEAEEIAKKAEEEAKAAEEAAKKAEEEAAAKEAEASEKADAETSDSDATEETESSEAEEKDSSDKEEKKDA